MARKGYGRNSTLVNINTHPDDGTSPVGSNEWNENPKKDGIFGLTKSTQAISSNDIDVTDSYIEVSNAGDIYTLSAVTTSLPSANYASDSASSISEGDLIYVVKAAGVGTVNLKHQNGGAGAGKITTLTAGDKALSATIPTILMARTIGSALEWVEYGGAAVADGSITSAKIADGTIVNDDINSSAGIALSKLASDPLARANHTGSQAASTISDFDTEVANNTAVAANTAKVTNATHTGDVTGSTALSIASDVVGATELGVTAGTATASKALVIDSNKDLTGVRNLTVAGDLTVNGTTTTINSTTLTVDDKNIEMGSVASPSDTTADGGGITLKGSTDKTINWVNSTDSWTFNQAIDISGNNVDNVQNIIHDFSTTTTAVNFTADEFQDISISANTTFTGSNYAIGKSKTIVITTDGTARTLTFPSGWIFIGAKPANQAASKIGVLTLTCRTGAESGVIASYGVQD